MRTLRIFMMLCPLSVAATGCAVPETWERVSPDTEGYRDYIETVTAAYRQDDGSVVICVTGQRAAVPPLMFGRLPVEPFSLVLAADAGTRTVPGDHAPLHRYIPAPDEIGGPCATRDASGTSLPVRIVESRDFGNPDFDWLSDAALERAIDEQPETPAIMVFMSEGWWRPGKRPDTDTEGWWRAARDPRIVYVDPEPRFDGAKAVLIEPGLRPADGNVAYIALLPAAAAIDIVAVPLFLLAAATGIYKG